MIKFILTSSLFIGLSFTQSKVDIYGMGLPPENSDVASSGISSSGLIPTFQQNISLSNPSTWSSSKFTLFSGTFRGSTKLFIRDNIQNQHSNLDGLVFIIPIKEKYAFGIGLSPFLNQNLVLSNNNTLVGQPNEPQNQIQELKYTGGISSLQVSGGFSLGSKGFGGIEFDFLFGSVRVQELADVDEITLIFNQRKLFKGIVTKLFYSTKPILYDAKEFTFYFNLGWTLRDFNAEIESYQPFLDSNQNGIHDIAPYDFPGIDKSPTPEVINLEKFYNPFELKAGVKMVPSSNIALLYEGGFWKNTYSVPEKLTSFNNGISKKWYISQGLLKYADNFPSSFYNKFHWRIGYSFSQLSFQNQSDKINKQDVSLGIGLPFGKLGNQVDIAYIHSNLRGDHLINETEKSIKIGLTIGDIWFVKRRNR